MNGKGLLAYAVVLITTISCQSPELDAVGETYLDLPATPFEYDVFGDSANAKAALGRVLFYDRQMSLNNTTSCASCHKQSFGFADNQKFSRGFESRFTTRNSMPIQNMAQIQFIANDTKSNVSSLPFPGDNFFPGGNHFFWDGRERSLEKLILQPVGNHIEMGITDIDALTEKLSAQPHYAPLFNDAFGSTEITADRISIAVSTFVGAINTNNTRFDQYMMSRFEVDQPTLTVAKQEILNSLEIEGMLLFQNKYDCNSCHQVQTPNGYELVGTFANIGLDKTYADPGLQNVTGKPEDAGKFKIPSLRNLAFTAPYMHDGRFQNLDDVMEHYSEGMADHPNIDEKLKDNTGHARSMNISEHEKEAIIAFLNTLNDASVTTHPKFSNPFKVK